MEHDLWSIIFRNQGPHGLRGLGLHTANVVTPTPKLETEDDLLATPDNRLDAVVQCGTNMSVMDVAERLEPVIGMPILGINTVTFWHGLREDGFAGALVGAGRLLREF